MAKVKIQGHASGSGVLTVTAPNTSSDRTITLPDATGTLLTEVADDSITLDKMASGTDGNIISYDASGDPVAIATGNDGQVLTSTGAGSPPAFEDAAAGGAWTLIGTAVASGSSTLDITGLSSTYDHYAISVSDIKPAQDSTAIRLRFGDSNGVDSGSDYAYHTTGLADNATNFAGANSTSADNIKLAKDNLVSGSGKGFGGMFFLHRPGDGNIVPIVSGTMCFVDNGALRGGLTMGRMLSVITLDRVHISMSSGTITSGRLSVWGIAHA